MTGATGLLIRQLMARKVGAAESYQQMAEAAASNGFNRIINELNSNDKGYLWTIKNGDTTSTNNWAQINEKEESTLEELCTIISPFKDHPSYKEAIWPTGYAANAQTNVSFPFTKYPTRTQMNDGKGSIQTFYRLRQYEAPRPSVRGSYEGRKGRAVFQVEGFVRRVGSPEEEYLAKSLLSRSLHVRSVVSKPEDWGVLAANSFDLGSTTINGPGLIIWNVDNKDEVPNVNVDKKGCDNDRLAALIKGRTKTEIWPILNRELPSIELFYNTKNSTKVYPVFDADPDNPGIERIWSFDDSNEVNESFNCGEEQIVCTRAFNSKTMSAPNIDIISDVIGKETVVKTRVKTGIDLSAKRICLQWKCYTPVPGRKGRWYWSYSDKYDANGTSWVEETIEKELKKWTVLIKKQDICANKDGACHLYIEHMNLENTTVLIENKVENISRPVVLHLGGGDSGSELSKRIDLSNKSKLCGVNVGKDTLHERIPVCNENPEDFVITAKTGDSNAKNCNLDDLKKPVKFHENNSYVVNIAGESLPAAFVLLNNGTFTLSSDAKMRGVVWADNFCSQDNNFTLTTKPKAELKGSVSVIETGNELWNLVDGVNMTGYGRTITRGVRGTGIDIFQRW